MSKEGKWLVNLHYGEVWYNDEEFSTKEEAVTYGTEEYQRLYEDEFGEKFDKENNQKVFYVGRVHRFIPTICEGTTSMIMERIVDDAYDEAGEVAEGYLEGVSKEEFNFFKERLNEALNDWLDETKYHPTFYKVGDIEEIVVEGDDDSE